MSRAIDSLLETRPGSQVLALSLGLLTIDMDVEMSKAFLTLAFAKVFVTPSKLNISVSVDLYALGFQLKPQVYSGIFIFLDPLP